MMTGKIPEHLIEQIRSQSDIVDVISDYMQLTKRGRNWFGLCPFHGEQTPSFSVSQDKQIFHCFGCGAGGNAITFIMDMEQIPFPDALYDIRYKSLEGARDIINKVVDNIYGEFLPEATSVLLYNDRPCGFAFANVTGGKIANVPLVAIDKNHRGKGFSSLLLNRTIKTIVDWTKIGSRDFSEVNVTTETNNYKALKMYRKTGFREAVFFAKLISSLP